MQMLWCWRCKMEVPMLEGKEARQAEALYQAGFHNKEGDATLQARFNELVQYYESVTGWANEHPNVIIHHLVDLYGPPCEQCGKPYRTAQAAFCAACGHRRPTGFQPLVISFDLDDTLIPGAVPFDTEPHSWWQRVRGAELIRKGTAGLFKTLQSQGHTLCIYTTSLRPPRRVKSMLAGYGIGVDRVITRQTHLDNPGARHTGASKYPPAFGIDLHIDDSAGVAQEGARHGFQTLIVSPTQADWVAFVLDGIAQHARRWKQR